MKLQTCPGLQQLKQLVEGTLNEKTETAVEEHLSACESCRSKVEQNIQSADWWQQARSSLRSSSRDADADDSSHAPVDLLSLLGPTDDPEKIGRIAEYEVIGIIGRGGMGVVFKAFDPRLNRFVAIKMLLPHLAASGAARKRFAREGQAAAAVVDDFVLPIYAVSEWKGVPYLVTQYSRGTTLQKRVESDGPLEVKEILRLGMQTARGLAAAHAQGLVHRDVKPSNILLDGSVERAMLTDFGLARAVDDASITRTGVIAGTPQYMSPEQARGGSVDVRSDLFSLGCVLYFLCTGHPPFRADNSYAILRLITDEEPRSIREINPDIPAWLSSIVQKLMVKKAEDRYGSAREVAELLEACLAHVSNPLKNSLPTVVSRPSLRFRWNAIMSDKRILSLVAFGLFVAALLLPWPIAAIGRDEHALIFAGVSMLLAVTFAVMSRCESFSRIVLVTVGGMFGLLLVGVLLSVPIYYWRGNVELEAAQLRAMNDAIVSEARAMQAAQNAPPTEFRKLTTEIGQPGGTSLHSDRGTPDQPSGLDLITSDDPTTELAPARKTNLSALNVDRDNEHSPKKTETVQILLDVSKHPREMLEKNLNYQGLSLYAAGVMTRAEGSDAMAPATVVVAHDCTLRAFEEVERDGEKFWAATLVVPMQNELLDLRPGMTLEEAEAKFDPKAFQDRLDKWREDGARFELDHYLGQEPKNEPAIAAPAEVNPDGEQDLEGAGL